ncbi:hypothetical protein K439DRAFT_418636 [Ramaria rubella]|nr:hypothetical protein K439DRAFT_418636 [Ramaria rubella]
MSQAAAQVVQEQYLWNYAYSSALVFFTYDHIISVSREAELIWRRNFRLTTFLYFATRYLPLPLLVWQLIPSSSFPDDETVLDNWSREQRV